MITRRPGRSQPLPAAYLALAALADVAHTSSTEACHDHFHNRVPCPKQPINSTKVIIIVAVSCVVVSAIAGFFLVRIFRRKRAQTYQHLPVPFPGTLDTQQGVMMPAAPGEMGYAGLQPEVPCVAPQLAYKAPQHPSCAPQEVKPYIPLHPPPPPLAYVPSSDPLPQPQAAATLYGYSAVPV